MRVLDDTREDLKRLIAADFGTSSTGDYRADFVNWIHHRARRIPQLPRRMFVSPQVTHQIPHFPAIDQITRALTSGDDVGPWLSNNIRTNKHNYRADMMFNDWQIVHFHLGRFFQSPATVRRTGPLLFAHITAQQATFLDVQCHGAWTKTAMLEILLHTNPPALERYEARAVTPTRLSDAQYQSLRANCGNSHIEINGRAFRPGGGILASGHALRLCDYSDYFFITVEKLLENFEADMVEPKLRPAIYARLGIPVRLGAYYDHNGLAIIDKNRNGLVLCQMKPLE